METDTGTLMRTVSTKQRKRRQKLRERLLAEGVNARLVDKIIEQQRHDDLVTRHGLEEARAIAYTEAQRQDKHWDDTGYEPKLGDPLLRGPARVGGITAQVVKRRDTITRFQYDRVTDKRKTITP